MLNNENSIFSPRYRQNYILLLLLPLLFMCTYKYNKCMCGSPSHSTYMKVKRQLRGIDTS